MRNYLNVSREDVFTYKTRYIDGLPDSPLALTFQVFTATIAFDTIVVEFNGTAADVTNKIRGYHVPFEEHEAVKDITVTATPDFGADQVFVQEVAAGNPRIDIFVENQNFGVSIPNEFHLFAMGKERDLKLMEYMTPSKLAELFRTPSANPNRTPLKTILDAYTSLTQEVSPPFALWEPEHWQ